MGKQSFYANGKLLITGEYLVLEGALALAVPTVLGQKMIVNKVREHENSGIRARIIKWRSYYQDKCWFEGEFKIPGFDIVNTSNESKAAFIADLLAEANRMNLDHLSGRDIFEIETHLDFDPGWGLGSSSSLTVLIAEWFSIDPWELFRKTQSGSGYDITCARVMNPVWYRLANTVPIAQKADFNPAFKDSLAFIYSGRKQDSALSVKEFRNREQKLSEEMDRISAISRKLPEAASLQEFNALIDEHESIMSGILQLPEIKDKFPDFPGSMKSLGAWGGDFILAASDVGFEEIKHYFRTKQLNVVFSFDEIVQGAGHQATGTG